MAEQKPLVSILMAVRNDGRFIKETLESVVKQTSRDWEMIVMDGASTDNTVEIIKDYASRYPNIIWRSEPDKGQWDALDKALTLVRGKYITLLCGQDGYLNKTWLEKACAALEANSDVSLVWGIPFNMSEEGKLVGPHYAYAGWLNDPEYKEHTKPLETLAAKIDWKRPASWKRLGQMLTKLTPGRIMMLVKSFKPQPLPQKETWFKFWLKTGRAFPEGNMVMHTEVYKRLTTRFPAETKTNAALLDFCFNFNSQGYLSYCLPLAANFSRSHETQHNLREFDAQLTAAYQKKVALFREQFKGRQDFKFLAPDGTVAR